LYATSFSHVLRGSGLDAELIGCLAWDHRPPTVVASRNAADHARKRKPWDRAFVGSAMSEYQVIIVDRVRELADGMDGIIRDAAKEKRETQVDLCAWFDYFA
jgi:cytochrome P450